MTQAEDPAEQIDNPGPRRDDVGRSRRRQRLHRLQRRVPCSGAGLDTALVVTAGSLVEGIHRAFLVDAVLAVCGLVVAMLFVGGRVDKERLRTMRHHHRAHAP